MQTLKAIGRTYYLFSAVDLDKSIVDANFTELVFDDSNPLAMVFGEKIVDECRLTASKEACKEA
jgi:hypothetical protein